MAQSPPYYKGPTASNPAELFRQIDTDNDGNISFEEAANWYAKMTNRSVEDVLADSEFGGTFKFVDANGDGTVQEKEMEDALELAMDN